MSGQKIIDALEEDKVDATAIQAAALTWARYADHFPLIANRPFAVAPATAAWEDYSPAEQAHARIAAREVVDSYSSVLSKSILQPVAPEGTVVDLSDVVSEAEQLDPPSPELVELLNSAAPWEVKAELDANVTIEVNQRALHDAFRLWCGISPKVKEGAEGYVPGYDPAPVELVVLRDLIARYERSKATEMCEVPNGQFGWVCYNGGPGSMFWMPTRESCEHELSEDIRPATALEKSLFEHFGKAGAVGFEITPSEDKEETFTRAEMDAVLKAAFPMVRVDDRGDHVALILCQEKPTMPQFPGGSPRAAEQWFELGAIAMRDQMKLQPVAKPFVDEARLLDLIDVLVRAASEHAFKGSARPEDRPAYEKDLADAKRALTRFVKGEE